jgi:hypothetical protein
MAKRCRSCCTPVVVECGSIGITVNGCNSRSVAGSVVTLTRKQVVSVAVTAGGSGYTSPPTVVFATTNGRGASAVAVLVGGVVDHVDVVTGGTYSAAPLVSFSGGGGSGAAASATLSAPITVDTIPTNIGIFNFTFGTHGTGYSGDVGAPAVTISGGGGTGARATAVLSTVSITILTVTGGGSGYQIAPLVSASGGGGSASITSRLTAGPVTSLRLTAGSGLTPGTGFPITFSGGGGSGAAGTFDVDNNGKVYNLQLTAGGSLYTSAPSLTLSGGATAFATIASGAVNSLNLESGTGYTTGTGYALGFSGGNGTGAAGTFDVDGSGKVTNLQLTAGGSNYTTNPTLSFPGAGSGTGATGTVLLGPTSVASLVGSGSGYTSTPAITITAIAGGGGSGATGTATIASQNVASLTLVNPGRDFTSAPTVTIGPPSSGTTATATANLASAGSEQSFFVTPLIGTYTASVVPPAGTPWWNTAPVTANVLVATCGSNATGLLTLVPVAGFACHCVQCRDALPDTCTVTDGNGTYTATWHAGSNAWLCCYTLPGQTVMTFAGGICTTPTSAGSVAVAYSVFCPTAATPFRISESWTGCSTSQLLGGTCTADVPTGASTSGIVGTITGTGGGANNTCNDSVSFAMTGALVNGTVAVTFP